MKKTILVSALVLVALIGVGTGAYLLYEYNENKPLILKCTDNVSKSNTILKIDDSPYYWNSAEEEWVNDTYRRPLDPSWIHSFEIEKNRFSWKRGAYLKKGEKTEIDRNTGDYSVKVCNEGPCLYDYLYDAVLSEGTCTKSGEPAKTLKQKF